MVEIVVPLAARLQAKHASFEVDADPVSAQELVTDRPAELETEQRARRRQIQHDHRKVLVPNRVEGQIDALLSRRTEVEASIESFIKVISDELEHVRQDQSDESSDTALAPTA